MIFLPFTVEYNLNSYKLFSFFQPVEQIFQTISPISTCHSAYIPTTPTLHQPHLLKEPMFPPEWLKVQRSWMMSVSRLAVQESFGVHLHLEGRRKNIVHLIAKECQSGSYGETSTVVFSRVRTIGYVNGGLIHERVCRCADAPCVPWWMHTYVGNRCVCMAVVVCGSGSRCY